MTALLVEHLRFAYDRELALDDVSFETGDSESVAIVGANGSGKSTLLWCVAGLLRASGRILIFGEPPGKKALARIGMVFQNPEDQLFMPTLIQDLALPLLNAGNGRDEAHRAATALLREFGLEKYGDRPASHLSLGQRKRAAVALALVRKPDLLLFDEPTAELDGRAQRQLSATLQNLVVAKLVASHDLDFLRRVTTRALVLSGGRIIASGPTQEVLSDSDLLDRAGLV
ncbi:MAG: energy-coupling factor ABC transporter ATP-binding protein [Bryobacteraceae bacterium]